MPFGDLKFGRGNKQEPSRITLERGGEKTEVPNVLGYFDGKRINLPRAKEILEEYLKKVPDATWAEVKGHFSKVLAESGEKDSTALKIHFNTIKADRQKQMRVVQESDPVFNQVALFINKELKESSGTATYEDIIVKFFTEKEDDPIIDKIDDAMLARCEAIYDKMKLKFNV
jgi:hypothetical protein